MYPQISHRSFRSLYAVAPVFLLIVLIGGVLPAFGQFDGLERSRAKDMLKSVKNALKDEYFDTSFRGMDLDARFKLAEEKINSAASLGQAFGVIAQVVLELNDSHTKFFPPARTIKTEYGWRMQMFGDKCLVTGIQPGSDAEKQGLKPGDEIIQVEGFKPSRKDLWKLNYYYNVISPRRGLAVKVQSPGETTPRELQIAAKTKTEKAVLSLEDVIRQIDLDSSAGLTHRFVKVGNTTVWKMPSFSIEPESVNGIMEGRIRDAANLILDLRGNGGGYVVTLERLAGYFVEANTEIATLKGRKPMKPVLAKAAGKNVFTGKLIVLIDSNSGSASEIFARFMQLQQRGVVIGERSAGAVMQSRAHPMKMGVDSIIPFGMSITNADVIMSDGMSLEHAGVMPHVEIVQTGSDLRNGDDPVLAAALTLLGMETSPAAAGKMFPFKWEEN